MDATCVAACVSSPFNFQLGTFLGSFTAGLCATGLLLKEMIEDLEWTAVGSNNSTVEVCMQRQPRRLLFTAQAAGSLQVSHTVLQTDSSAVLMRS